MKKIICAHLYNDFSGSPLVLSTVVKNLASEGHDVEVLTSRQGTGFLSNLPDVGYRFFTYRFFQNKLLRLAMLLWAQVSMFCQVWQLRRQTTVVYVNTLLPFGAALAGRLCGKKVIYHLHETTVNPPVLKGFLKKVATCCASEAIYVSKFLQAAEPLPGVPSTVVHNCLSHDFTDKADAYLQDRPIKTTAFTVLMLCSLKKYKGVDQFVALAEQLPRYQFLLVLNAGDDAIQQYFAGQSLPENLVIFPSQQAVHSFYQEAHLVLNLSHPEQWVETFGMTLLEAMSYGLPVIAPPVGGPTELVENGYNGFQLDQRNLAAVAEKITDLATEPEMYLQLSANALTFSAQFQETHFRHAVMRSVRSKPQRTLPIYRLAEAFSSPHLMV